MFYSYGSRSNLIKLVNDITTPFLLQDFYEKSIADSGLPISQENHSAIENIIKTQYGTVTERLNALKTNKKRGYLPSVISIDNIYPSQKTTPMLTTIDIPKKEMAHLAVTLLTDRRNGKHRENIRIELPCRLVERDSCTYNY